MSALKRNGKPEIAVGVCMKLGQMELADDIHADYIEFPFADVAGLEEEAWNTFLQKIEEKQITCCAMTQLLPKKISIVEQDNAYETLEAYFQKGFQRAKQLGVQTVVYGNAASRNVKKGNSYENAQKRLAVFLDKVSCLAWEYGIRIGIEPLNRTQSNYINTVAEAETVIADVENAGIVLDYFHFQVEKEQFEDIANSQGRVIHCHTASLLYRSIPDREEQMPLINWMKNCQYRGGLSFEFDRFPEDAEALNQALESFRIALNEEKENGSAWEN